MRRGPTTLPACFDRAAQAGLPAASLPPAWRPAWRRQPGRTPPARPAGPSQAASTAQEPEEPSPLRRSEEQARLEAAPPALRGAVEVEVIFPVADEAVAAAREARAKAVRASMSMQRLLPCTPDVTMHTR